MGRSSHKHQSQAVIESSPRSTFRDLGEDSLAGRAMDALNSNLASQKEWAIELRVHPSMISMWISGAKPLAEDSAKSILAVAEILALQQAQAASVLAYEIRCFLTGRKP